MAWNVRADRKQLLDVCSRAEVHPSIMAGMIRHQSRNYKLYPELHHSMDVKSAFGFAND
jgi:HTH-type transcriptional regulator/antitoxin HigA